MAQENWQPKELPSQILMSHNYDTALGAYLVAKRLKDNDRLFTILLYVDFVIEIWGKEHNNDNE